jgi:hypothetical protein
VIHLFAVMPVKTCPVPDPVPAAEELFAVLKRARALAVERRLKQFRWEQPDHVVRQ